MLTPYDFHAVGDGVADDTKPLNDWFAAIAGKAGEGAPGVFKYTSTVEFYGNTTVYGAGKGAFELYNPTVSEAIMLNKNPVRPGDGERIDKNVAFYGTCFSGDPNLQETQHDFVDFIGIDGLTLRDCWVKDRRRDGWVLSNNNNVAIDTNELSNLGSTKPFTNHGSGTWAGGMGINFLTPNFNIRVTNNYLHDFPGAGGIWLPVINTFAPQPPEASMLTCTGNILQSMVEVGIVGSCDNSTVSLNQVRDIKQIDVSGHGFEMHGKNYTFANNTAEYCDATCAYLANMTDVTISGNTLNYANRLGASITGNLVIATFPDSAGEGSLPPNGCTIIGNRIKPLSSKGWNAILFVNLSGIPSRLMFDMLTTQNNLGVSSSWKNGVIGYHPSPQTVAGSNFVVRQ